MIDELLVFVELLWFWRSRKVRSRVCGRGEQVKQQLRSCREMTSLLRGLSSLEFAFCMESSRLDQIYYSMHLNDRPSAFWRF